jgi:ABC-type polysaccharide/polyol phosphate transport system ATPase subunit
MRRGLPNAPDELVPAAIAVDGLSKSYRLPHERRTTLKEYFLHPLRRIDYEEQRALREVSFRVERGEFFGIIGPNGSGKSTLLKIIAGIYRQDTGSVRVTGILSPFIELGVGFHPELTARDNIRINGTLLGLDRRELDARQETIVRFAGLERFVDQKLKNFSSGMQVRLAYAIAIQVDFDILLLDEVLAVGDESFQQKCFETFITFRAAGKTIVLVTHALNLIERFADRALLLQDGEVRAQGTPSDVVAQYHEDLAAQAVASRVHVLGPAS